MQYTSQWNVLSSDCRNEGLNKLHYLNPAISQKSNLAKVKYLFFNENTPIQLLDAAAEMLLSLYNTRESLLSNYVSTKK